MVLERQDKYPEALAAARKAKQIRPWYRPAVQTAAHLLQLLDCDAEAPSCSASATGWRAGRSRAARHARVGAEAVQRRGPAGRRWRRCRRWRRRTSPRRSPFVATPPPTTAATTPPRPSGPAVGQRIPQGPCQGLAETGGAGAGGPADRLRPPAPHDCAPATLSTLGRYWSSKVEHLSLAEEIRDGTSSHSERSWANKGGWVSREFTVTQAAPSHCSTSGPFTLTTVEPASGHLQAVIGYDSVRGTLLIRDLRSRNAREFLCDKLIERYKSSGPRGMAIVPADKASLLEGLDLPDADLHDRLFAVTDALVRYKARRGGRGLRGHAGRRPRPPADPPGPPIHRRLRQQPDRDPPVRRRGARPYPDPNTLLTKLSCLRALGAHEPQPRCCAVACAAEDADPLFWSELARSVRRRPRIPSHAAAAPPHTALPQGRAQSYSGWRAAVGTVPAKRRRCSAGPCASTCREQYARSYFVAPPLQAGRGCALCRTGSAGRRQVQRPGADAVLGVRGDEPRDRRVQPGQRGRDGPSRRRRAAPVYRRRPRPLRRPRWRRRGCWGGRRTGRRRRRGCGRPPASPSCGPTRASAVAWRQVVEAEPLAIDGHQNVAQLLAETEGRAQPLAHLEAAADRFHCDPLLRLLIEFVQSRARRPSRSSAG